MRPTLKQVARGWRWGHRSLVPRSIELPPIEQREFPTQWARTPSAKALRTLILRLGFGPLVRHEVDLHVEGIEVLDRLEPPVIFIANHSSHLDAPLILTSLPNSWRDKTAVGAAADYFFDVWWRAVGTTLAFNTFPVERAGSRKSSGLGRHLLGEGWNLLVFPEGTRSKDGWMGDFKTGTAHLAIQNGVPIVPIGLVGSYQAMPKGRGWPAPGKPRVTLRFGEPVRADGKQDARAFTVRLREELNFVIEEERATWWNALHRRKASQLPEGRGPEAAHWRRMWESSRPIPKERKTVFRNS